MKASPRWFLFTFFIAAGVLVAAFVLATLPKKEAFTVGNPLKSKLDLAQRKVEPLAETRQPLPQPKPLETAHEATPATAKEEIVAAAPPLDAFEGVLAQVSAGGSMRQLKVDSLGGFAQVAVTVREKIAVEISCPAGVAGQPISLEVADGGQIAGKMGAILPLGQDKKLTFTYEAGTADGIYRVQLRAGDNYRELQFWVGPQT